jgi:hypothetical protein
MSEVFTTSNIQKNNSTNLKKLQIKTKKEKDWVEGYKKFK